eukprot:scaffold701402_cov55-Attheya_sp.AAC.1
MSVDGHRVAGVLDNIGGNKQSKKGTAGCSSCFFYHRNRIKNKSKIKVLEGARLEGKLIIQLCPFNKV